MGDEFPTEYEIMEKYYMPMRKHTCMKHFPSAVISFKYPQKQRTSYWICSTLDANTFFSSGLGARCEYLQSVKET